MKRRSLAELFAGLGTVCVRGSVDPQLIPLSITLDIEEVTDGTLFVARKLWYENTHQHVEEAIRRGAVAILVSELEGLPQESTVPICHAAAEDPTLGILCDRFYDYPTAHLKVYGVTGTNGKTSAVSYLAELLEAVGERVAVMGTVAFTFEEHCLPASNTTPDALVIHRFARQALDLGATALALEVSSHGLSLARVAGVTFDAVGFTSFGRDHLDFHGSLEAYRSAKALLFDNYLIASLKRGKYPVAVAHDDEEGLRMLSHAPVVAQRTLCRVSAYRSEDDINTLKEHYREVQPVEGESWLQFWMTSEPTVKGIELAGIFKTGDEDTLLSPQSAPLIGDYHPANLAIALGMVAGTHTQHLHKAWRSISQSRGVSGRMERVVIDTELEEHVAGRVALVDYAHTPDAIARALQALRAVHEGPISVVVGCGGDRDRGKRPEMVQAALASADVVWLTSDNPRSEEPAQIIADALQGNQSTASNTLFVKEDRRECIRDAWCQLPDNGALLITGKGHETYQEVGDRRYRLNDHEALRAATWAQALELPLGAVPYARSLSDLAQNSKQKIMTLLSEACARPGGLLISVLQTTQQSEEKSSEDASSLLIHLKAGEDPSPSRHTDLLNALSFELSQALCPSIKHVLIYIEGHHASEEVRQVLVEYQALLASASPPLLLHLSWSSKRAVDQPVGGWPKVVIGPKIPTLGSYS